MNDNGLFREIEEDIQRQRFEALWKKYGLTVVSAAIAIVLATAAVTAWKNHRSDVRREATSGLVELAYSGEKDINKRLEAMEGFAAAHGSTNQAALARLKAASLAAAKGETAKAGEIYGSVAEDNDAAADLRQLAALLAVNVRLDDGDATELRAKLEPLMKPDGIWRLSATEMAAHLALRSGDKAEAKRLFAILEHDNGEDSSPAMSRRAADMLRWLNNGE